MIDAAMARVDRLAGLIWQMWLQRHPKQDALVDTPSPDGVDTGEWAEFRINPTTYRSYDTRRHDSPGWTRAISLNQATETTSGSVAHHLVQAYGYLSRTLGCRRRPPSLPAGPIPPGPLLTLAPCTTGTFILSLQPKDLVLPLSSDKARHIDGSIVRPQDPQDPRRSLPDVKPIWQRLPGTLSFDGMPIAGRRRLLSTKFIEWCPEAKYPAPYPQLGQPHHITLDLHCSVPP